MYYLIQLSEEGIPYISEDDSFEVEWYTDNIEIINREGEIEKACFLAVKLLNGTPNEHWFEIDKEMFASVVDPSLIDIIDGNIPTLATLADISAKASSKVLLLLAKILENQDKNLKLQSEILKKQADILLALRGEVNNVSNS